MNERQQAAARITGFHVGIDRDGKLMFRCLSPDAIKRLAVAGVRLPPIPDRKA